VLYHLAGDGCASRLEWAEEILSLLKERGGEPKVRAREIVAAKTSDFPAPAKRPFSSALDCAKFERTFGFKLEPWRQALKSALASAGDRT
jgi:dTDP-4-dehydrorhamnose reductase